MAAIDVAEKQMNSLEPREDLTEKISAVGDWHCRRSALFALARQAPLMRMLMRPLIIRTHLLEV
jgi:hypothetical protein